MKRLLYTLTLLLAFVAMSHAQTTVVGKVVEDGTNEPLIGATVIVQGTTVGTTTDLDGGFSLEVPEGYKKLEVQYVGYSTQSIDITALEDGLIMLIADAYGLDEVVVTGYLDIVRDRRTPVAVSTVNRTELQAKAVGNVELVEAIKNTPSVYVSSQTGFGDSEMFLRGFDQINTAFLFNGQPINGMEDGRMYWSNWSGVSDIANAVQVQRGLGSSKLAISSVGGTVNFVTKTVEKEKGGFARFMYGNDNYIKGTVAYNTGLSNKWAFSIMLDHWQADNKWAEGTKGQGQNYFLSVGFKPNDHHMFNFLVTGAPQWHGQRWSQSLETLEETPKFNQHWGEYDGEFETERRNYYHKPIINLSWDWEMNSRSSLSTVAYASFGRGGGTGNWGSNRRRTADGQVDWDAIEADNLADDDGIGDEDENYALRSSVNNHQWFGVVSNFEREINPNLTWNVGADLRFYRGDHFRQFVDFFGLDGYQESDGQFGRPDDYVVRNTFDARPWAALFDFADEDDRIDYDYSENINYQGLFTQLEYEKDAFTSFIQGSVSNQGYQRDGRASEPGKSDKVNKVGFNIKGGASYALSSMSTVFANIGYYSRQPFLDNIFEDIRGSNTLLTPDIDNEDIFSVEAGYKFLSKKLFANLNVFYTTWGNRTRVDTYTNDNDTPDDESDDFQQRDVERGIGQKHLGLEVDAQYILTDKITLRGFTSIGKYTFTAIESVTQFNDDTGDIIGEIEGADNEGVHIPGAPQFSFGLGARANFFENLDVYVDYNFYDKIYIRGFDDVLLEDVGTLDAYGQVDIGASYKFGLGSQSLILRGNIYNLLDNDAINQSDAFGFFNMNGLTWNTSIQLMF